MKENELRIGNFVRYRDEKDCKVSSIGSNGFETIYIEKDQANGSDDLREYKPIPLNEQWLLKFGFEKFDNPNNTSSWIWNKEGETWFYETWRDGDIFIKKFLIGNNNNNIKYVHQLQNLYFALTGTELSPN